MTHQFEKGHLVLPRTKKDEQWVRKNHRFIGQPPWEVYSSSAESFQPTLRLCYEESYSKQKGIKRVTEGFFIARFIPCEKTIDLSSLL